MVAKTKCIACRCTGTSIGLITPFACCDKFGLQHQGIQMVFLKLKLRNLKILFHGNKLDALRQEC